jgi:hypothetical protein
VAAFEAISLLSKISLVAQVLKPLGRAGSNRAHSVGSIGILVSPDP